MEEKKKGSALWRVLTVIFALLFIVSAVLLVLSLRGCEGDLSPFKNTDATLPSEETAQSTQAASTGTDETTEPATHPLPDNPTNFAALAEVNTDIHAWITVPGTPIDYPVLRSPDNALYYERRDYTGAYSVSGCIFTQFYNDADFSDRNTIVYGHYMYDGTFFGSLHNFRDPEFFEENRYIYINIPGHVLKYEIFAAYEYDNRHILYAFDFADDNVYEQYLADCLDPATMSRNVREGVTLTTDDRIITLSTCLANGDKNYRYLVQGVLVEDVRTK